MRIFSRFEELKEEKTRGNGTYQFHQGIAEKRDNARKYIDYLKTKFKDEIDTMESNRAESVNIVRETEKVHGKIATVKFGQQQASLARTLIILRGELERKRTSLKEAELYTRFL